MFSAAYSTNCVTFDPKGKLLQIDYAKEAVKQGSTSIGLKSDNYVVSAQRSSKCFPEDTIAFAEGSLF
jgi:20S proteasome alpha/beta subunit